MKVSSMLVIFLPLLTLFFQSSHSSTMVVDGVTEWRNPIVHVGDTVVFKHRYHYQLYIFQNEKAFNLCNFAQATLLTKRNSTSFTWYPSRPGFFYFSFNNGSLTICEEQKLAIKVSLTPPENPATSPELPPRSAPAPISGGVVSSSPAYPWPFLSHGKSLTPSSSPAPKSSPLSPDNGDGEPFINSNPAVPLPTGEVDSATIRPLATSNQAKQILGLLSVELRLCCVALLLL